MNGDDCVPIINKNRWGARFDMQAIASWPLEYRVNCSNKYGDKNKLEMHSFLRNSLGINCSGHKQFKTTPRFREPDSVYLVALPPVGCCPRIYCLRWLTTRSMTQQAGREKEGKEKGKGKAHFFPLRVPGWNCTHNSHSYPIGQNLVMWPHQTAVQAGKCRLSSGQHVGS